VAQDTFASLWFLAVRSQEWRQQYKIEVKVSQSRPYSMWMKGDMVGIIGSTHGLVNSMWKMIGLSLEKPVHMRALFHPGDLMYASGWISSSKDWTSKLQNLNAPRTWHFPRKWQGQSLGLPTFLDKPLGHVYTLLWPRVKRCHGYGPLITFNSINQKETMQVTIVIKAHIWYRNKNFLCHPKFHS
jgi:hypothetical protein